MRKRRIVFGKFVDLGGPLLVLFVARDTQVCGDDIGFFVTAITTVIDEIPVFDHFHVVQVLAFHTEVHLSIYRYCLNASILFYCFIMRFRTRKRKGGSDRSEEKVLFFNPTQEERDTLREAVYLLPPVQMERVLPLYEHYDTLCSLVYTKKVQEDIDYSSLGDPTIRYNTEKQSGDTTVPRSENVEVTSRYRYGSFMYFFHHSIMCHIKQASSVTADCTKEMFIEIKAKNLVETIQIYHYLRGIEQFEFGNDYGTPAELGEIFKQSIQAKMKHMTESDINSMPLEDDTVLRETLSAYIKSEQLKQENPVVFHLTKNMTKSALVDYWRQVKPTDLVETLKKKFEEDMEKDHYAEMIKKETQSLTDAQKEWEESLKEKKELEEKKRLEEKELEEMEMKRLANEQLAEEALHAKEHVEKEVKRVVRSRYSGGDLRSTQSVAETYQKYPPDHKAAIDAPNAPPPPKYALERQARSISQLKREPQVNVHRQVTNVISILKSIEFDPSDTTSLPYDLIHQIFDRNFRLDYVSDDEKKIKKTYDQGLIGLIKEFDRILNKPVSELRVHEQDILPKIPQLLYAIFLSIYRTFTSDQDPITVKYSLKMATPLEFLSKQTIQTLIQKNSKETTLTQLIEILEFMTQEAPSSDTAVEIEENSQTTEGRNKPEALPTESS